MNTSSGNLERRFRRLREIRCPERAQLRDVSVENCMRVEQAPPTEILRTLQSSFSDARASRHQADKNNCIKHVLKLHDKLHDNGRTTREPSASLHQADLAPRRRPRSVGSERLQLPTSRLLPRAKGRG